MLLYSVVLSKYHSPHLTILKSIQQKLKWKSLGLNLIIDLSFKYNAKITMGNFYLSGVIHPKRVHLDFIKSKSIDVDSNPYVTLGDVTYLKRL